MFSSLNSHSFSSVPTLQPLLAEQIIALQKLLPSLQMVEAIYLVGSCSRSTATYRSDIDLLVVLNVKKLTFTTVQAIRDEFENYFETIGHANLLVLPLPIQITVVLDSVFATTEPAMLQALEKALPLFDPKNRLRAFIEGRAA